MLPSISVVLPVYNGQKHLRLSIESVLNQSHRDFELIIWNDASTDESEGIIESYQDSRIRRYSNSTNAGLFKTLNAAIRAAQGSLIRLWSQDDIMRPNCLQVELDFIKSHPEVGMTYCARDIIDETGRVTIPAPKYATPNLVSSELATQIMFFYGSITGNIANVMMKKEVLDEVGYFREDMQVSGDFEMWVRVSEKYPLGYIDETLIELRAHTGQFSRRKGIYVVFMREDQIIYEMLMKRLPPELNGYAQKYLRFRRYTTYVHYMFRSLLAGDLKTASESFRQIKRLDKNILLLAGFWLLSGNQRFYRMKPKYVGNCSYLNT